jgi:toxin-antitoxin system PIN domain toxin
MKRYLVDANVWLAVLYSDHLHHPQATSWMNALPSGSAFFCRITQITVLRLLCNPRVMGRDVVSPEAAWHYYDGLRSNRRVDFAVEPIGIEPTFRKFSSGPFASLNAWPDAYFAAFAVSSGMCVKTADQALRAVPGLDVELL